MGYFSKQIPLKPDMSLGPVIIGSKIRIEGGSEPLPLATGNVEIVPGCGWDGSTAVVTSDLTADQKRLRIKVALPSEVPLSHYVGTILARKPIQLKVTLFPQMLAAGTGIPLPVPGGSVTDEVDVTMPAIPRPDIVLDAQFTSRDTDGTYRVRVTATILLPPYISRSETAEVMRQLTFGVRDAKNAGVTRGPELPLGNGKELGLVVTPAGTAKDRTASFVVSASVSLGGLPLEASRKVEIGLEKKYILNIHPAAIAVSRKTPGSVTVQVLEEIADGRKILVTDAPISLSGGAGILALSPDKGNGRLESVVTQQKVSESKNIALTVSASAGTDTVPPTVITVSPETVDTGGLEVVFDPAGKTGLNPFIKSDHVVLRARVVAQDGGSPLPAVVSFEPANPEGWLDGPRESGADSSPVSTTAAPSADISAPVTTGDSEWTSVSFFGKVPASFPDVRPPGSDLVIVRATLDGQVIDERHVTIGLLPKPALIADTGTVNLLANAKRSRADKPEPVTSAPIRLSVINPGDEEWKISVEYTEKNLISCSEEDPGPSSKVFVFELSDEIPLPERKPGVASWQQAVQVRTTAVLGDLKIQGDPLTINILHEGIYPWSVVSYDKSGKQIDGPGKTAITYYVFDPAEARAPTYLDTEEDLDENHVFPYVTFVVMEWNGKELERNKKLLVVNDPDARRSNDLSREGSRWDFIFLDLKESFIEVKCDSADDMENRNAGRFHIIFIKQIPGNGERATGFVRFYVDPYYDRSAHEETINWQYELPVHLVLGVRSELDKKLSYIEEGTRCNRIIDRCFPELQREKLRRELALLPCMGAKDRRDFSRDLHKRANELWSQEQKDFLFYDKGWDWAIYLAEKAEVAGDLAFNACVMFYTAPLGPVSSLGLSTFASTIQSESKAVYADYIKHDRKPDFPTCVENYAVDHWEKFLISVISSNTVELYILKDFRMSELAKDPVKYGKMIAWLWLWKFSMHLAESIGNRDDMGIWVSAKMATEDVCGLAVNLLLGEFVQAHGNTSLSKLYGEVTKKGFFGGNAPEPGKRDEEKTGKKTEEDAAVTRPRPDDPGYFNNLRKGMRRDANGNWKASMEDVLELMRHPEEVRHLNAEGDPLVKEAFERTRQEIYTKHDKAVSDWIESSPEYQNWLKNHPECEGMPVEIIEFGTPGKESKLGEKLNTDRDYRAVVKIGYDPAGNPIYMEIPRNKVPWDIKSYEIFAKLTGGPNPEDPKSAFEWAEKHQQLGTDAIHKEASMDFKDQGHLKWNEETKQYEYVLHPSMESNVMNAVKGRAPLRDPEGIGAMYRTKVGDAVSHYGAPEGYAQAKKACEMLEKVQKGYSASPPDGMGYDIGTPPKNFTDAKAAVIKAGEKPWDSAAVQEANEKLKNLGYNDINDFTDALAGQFEWLKIARKRV